MSYLIAGVGAFLSLIVYLWRRSVKRQDVVIEDLTSHLEEERKKLYAVIRRKNKYISELENTIVSRGDPLGLLNRMFDGDPD